MDQLLKKHFYLRDKNGPYRAWLLTNNSVKKIEQILEKNDGDLNEKDEIIILV